MAVIEGGGLGDPLLNAGAPVAGTDEVQTLTIGGAPTTDTFNLTFDGWTTAAIAWSATNATLLSRINAALDALPNGAASAIVATAGTLTAGVGTILLTFSGQPLSKRAVPLMSGVRLSGSAITLAFAETTPGVDATARGIAVGGLLIDTTNKILYQNTGTAMLPTWQKVGVQT